MCFYSMQLYQTDKKDKKGIIGRIKDHLSGSGSGAGSSSDSDEEDEEEEFAKRILNLTNEKRKLHGVPELKFSKKVNK